MNQAGLTLELCEKHYDEHVIMLDNGTVFAESMHEAYDNKKICHLTQVHCGGVIPHD